MPVYLLSLFVVFATEFVALGLAAASQNRKKQIERGKKLVEFILSAFNILGF